MNTKHEPEDVDGENAIPRHGDVLNYLHAGLYRSTLGNLARIVKANPAMLSLFEADSEQAILSRGVRSLYQNAAQYDALCEKMVHQGFVKDEEMELLTLKGRPFWASITIVPEVEDGTIYYEGVVEDITARIIVEKRLNLQSKALEAAANEIVITDREGIILWVNPAFTRLSGYTAEEAIGNTPRLLRSGKQSPNYYRSLWETIQSGHVWHDEIVNKRKDGTLYTEEMTITPVPDQGGKIANFIAIKQDVSERKKAESALRESEQKFRSVVQSTIDAIVSSNEHGTIVYWNSGAERMFGYPENEVLGNPLTMLMPERFRAAHQRGIKSLQAKKPSSLVGRVVELYGLRKGGSEFPMELSLCSWEAGGNPFYTGTIRDTSERKKAQEQLGIAAEELRVRNAAMEDDLALAREVQESLLPQHYPLFPPTATPDDSALKFCHLYHPSGQVGGDFFDVVALSETQAAVFICDVMGHGIRAALVTATLRGVIEQILSSANDPGSFLTKLNQNFMRIFKYTEREMFATAFLLWVDTTTGEIQYANAGHPSPLHLNRKHRMVEPFCFTRDTRGPALGFVEDFQYVTSQNHLAEHDRVVLFTDGVYEVEGPDRQEYGQGRLMEFLRTKMDLSMEQFLDRLLADVHQFANGSKFEDDLCLVTLEVDRLVTL